MASNDLGRRQTGRKLGLTGVVALFSGLYALLLISGTPKDPFVWVQLLIGVAGIAAFFVTNFQTLGENFSGRGTVFLATSIVSSLLVAGALVGVNYIAVKKPHSWDLTKDKIYTLSTKTTDLLHGLTQEVQVLAFYSPGDPEYGELDSRLRQYSGETDKLKVEMLDPGKHLAEVKQYNISQTGPRVIAKLGAKEARAKELTEESLTNAIAEVTHGTSKKIYFTKGHGEHGLDDATDRGIKQFADALKSQGYTLEEILLAEHKEMPADAMELAISGPQTAFTDGEAKLVHDWVEKSAGKLLVMIDPTLVSGLESYLLTWGIALDNDTVIDPQSQQPQVAIAQSYADHPITSPKSGAKLSFTIFPFARSLSKKNAPAAWTLTELALTGAAAWGETGPLADAVQYDEGKDVKGPVTLAMSATTGSGDAESRVVVIGNSTFLANGFFPMSSNRDFGLNAVSWTARDESKITIQPRQRQSNHLFLSADQKRIMTLFAFDLMPFALLFAGLFVWQTRKAR